VRWFLVVAALGCAAATFAQQKPTKPTLTEVAELQKARAEMLRAVGEERKARAEAVKLLADADRAAQASPEPHELVSARNQHEQFFWDLGFKVAALVLAVVILVPALRRLREFSLSVGGMTITGKYPELPPGEPPPSAEASGVRSSASPGRPAAPAPAPSGLFLAHRASASRTPAVADVVCHLRAEDPRLLARVQKVTWILHPSFQPNLVTVTSPEDGFRFAFRSWAEFMLYADVYVEGSETPVRLSRYLTL
jgi:hypothetical protein